MAVSYSLPWKLFHPRCNLALPSKWIMLTYAGKSTGRVPEITSEEGGCPSSSVSIMLLGIKILRVSCGEISRIKSCLDYESKLSHVAAITADDFGLYL
ncbi:hypothetical protein GWI33_008593 [Rhynchophorus ferrugineus]|uniref:Uncharacterized protein n=1 Tax=Rhynchophorus ferrugineus TaxID=354439 RepID=A0A834ME02_RHYFE|nr:hypothetical protein GWI33_008593 [Rhynchophorus ferrugineus]